MFLVLACLCLYCTAVLVPDPMPVMSVCANAACSSPPDLVHDIQQASSGYLFAVEGSQDTFYRAALDLTAVGSVHAGVVLGEGVTLSSSLRVYLDGGNLWVSDGTASGTKSIKSLTRALTTMAVMNDVAYFLAEDPGSTFIALWRTDGTAAQTSVVGNLATIGGSDKDFGGELVASTTSVFATNKGGLYQYDGTKLTLVKRFCDVGTDPLCSNPVLHSAPTGVVVNARGSAPGGGAAALWYADETNATIICEDQTYCASPDIVLALHNIMPLLVVKGQALVSVSPTSATVVSSFPAMYSAAMPWYQMRAGYVLFVLKDAAAGKVALWRTAGTSGTTQQVGDVLNYTNPYAANMHFSYGLDAVFFEVGSLVSAGATRATAVDMWGWNDTLYLVSRMCVGASDCDASKDHSAALSNDFYFSVVEDASTLSLMKIMGPPVPSSVVRPSPTDGPEPTPTVAATGSTGSSLSPEIILIIIIVPSAVFLLVVIGVMCWANKNKRAGRRHKPNEIIRIRDTDFENRGDENFVDVEDLPAITSGGRSVSRSKSRSKSGKTSSSRKPLTGKPSSPTTRSGSGRRNTNKGRRPAVKVPTTKSRTATSTTGTPLSPTSPTGGRTDTPYTKTTSPDDGGGSYSEDGDMRISSDEEQEEVDVDGGDGDDEEELV